MEVLMMLSAQTVLLLQSCLPNAAGVEDVAEADTTRWRSQEKSLESHITLLSPDENSCNP